MQGGWERGEIGETVEHGDRKRSLEETGEPRRGEPQGATQGFGRNEAPGKTWHRHSATSPNRFISIPELAYQPPLTPSPPIPRPSYLLHTIRLIRIFLGRSTPWLMLPAPLRLRPLVLAARIY